jgi:hypothetical protein
VADKDEFFSPEDIDKQIDSVSQFKEGDRTDAEALAYLRSFYQADPQQEQNALDRIWNRIASAPLLEIDPRENEKDPTMQNSHIQYGVPIIGSSRPVRPARPARSPLVQRLGLLAAAVFLVALVGSMALVFYAARHNNGGTTSPHSTPPVSTSRVPLRVTSVTMSVTPGSIAGIPCGTNVTVTYTALFHVRPNSVGGTVKFNYTVNNGRGQTPASIVLKPGETTKSYAFTWSGALPIDHTYPQPGGIQVSAPNQLTSALVVPTGNCS